MQKNRKYKFVLIGLLVTNLFAHSRVAFSRPGSFIRTPSSIVDSHSNKYYIGFTNEAINTNDFISSNAVFFRGTSKHGYEYGLSYVQHAPLNSEDLTPLSETSFHIHKEMYNKNNFIINMGIHDALYQTTKDNQISLFISFINSNIILKNNYTLQTAIGFGSGKVNYDSYDYIEEVDHDLNIFLGLKFNTPILTKYSEKGLQLMIDYDGRGLNFGMNIPITQQIVIKTGFTQLNNFNDFNDYSDEESELIYSDAPGISIGFEFELPTATQTSPNLSETQTGYMLQNRETKNECFFLIQEGEFHDPLSVNSECEDKKLVELVKNFNMHITSLHDTLVINQQALKTEKTTNLSLKNQTKTLQDSINIQYLNKRISQSEMNIGMKFLSNSLKNFYEGDYYLALENIDQAQKYLPHLAYTYAREGSIYYKLGNLQKATMNWNIALQLDPEYSEVREMLANIKIDQSDIEGEPN